MDSEYLNEIFTGSFGTSSTIVGLSFLLLLFAPLPPWSPASSQNSNPDSVPIRSRSEAPISQNLRINPLVNPYPVLSLATQILSPFLLSEPLPLPVSAAHGARDFVETGPSCCQPNDVRPATADSASAYARV